MILSEQAVRPTVGGVMQGMLCRSLPYESHDHPTCERFAFARQHDLDNTSLISPERRGDTLRDASTEKAVVLLSASMETVQF
jgi:hypothetical protein